MEVGAEEEMVILLGGLNLGARNGVFALDAKGASFRLLA
jgi:hypothetical protein